MNPYNESLKGDRKFALQVNKTYRNLLKEISMKARSGDKKQALMLLEKMAEHNVVLYHLGFYVSDNGRLKHLRKKS